MIRPRSKTLSCELRGAGAMAKYKLYVIAGRRFSGFEQWHSPNDEQAIARTIQMIGGGDAELWCEHRLVKLFDGATSQDFAGETRMTPAAI